MYIHLAAQAGVRHSLQSTDYVKNNIEATTCILEACKNFKIKHFLFSSSSSVYGSSEKRSQRKIITQIYTILRGNSVAFVQSSVKDACYCHEIFYSLWSFWKT